MQGKFLIFPNARPGMPPAVLTLLIIGAAVRLTAMNAGSLLPLVLAQSTNPPSIDAIQPESNPAAAGLFDPTSSTFEIAHAIQATDRISIIANDDQTPIHAWPDLLATHSRPSRTATQLLTTEPTKQTQFQHFNDTTCTLSPAG